MNIKDLSKKSLDFTVKRVAEIIGILFICTSTLLFLSLISYSPEDPNFIFTDNTEIKNILGFRGSYTSDLFFQSIGLISYLVSDENNSSPQHTHRYVPSSVVFQYSPVKALSVALLRVTSYCMGVNLSRYCSSSLKSAIYPSPCGSVVPHNTDDYIASIISTYKSSS